jgi:hypothetical protein
MRKNRSALARLLVSDPETMRVMLAAMIEAGADADVLARMFKEAAGR